MDSLPLACGSSAPRVVELFAGVGGWHCAVLDSNIFSDYPNPIEQSNSKLDVTAVDISSVACKVYRHNFPDVTVLCKSVESFDKSLFESTDNNVSLLCMSPPCQPFTRIGLKRDLDDQRCNGLKHVCNILKECSSKFRPRMVVVENVAGFESSVARNLLIHTLMSCGYEWREFLLTPFDFQIPNARRRYYLAAAVTSDDTALTDDTVPPFINEADNVKEALTSIYGRSCSPVADFLCPSSSDTCDLYLSSEKHLRYVKVLDIVQSDDLHSMCFTSGYARYMEGTGSVLCVSKQNEVNDRTAGTAVAENTTTQREMLVTAKMLRFFSPREIANLLYFPSTFSWPSDCTNRQLYKCFGNSLNVRVAAFIVQVAADLLRKKSHDKMQKNSSPHQHTEKEFDNKGGNATLLS